MVNINPCGNTCAQGGWFVVRNSADKFARADRLVETNVAMMCVKDVPTARKRQRRIMRGGRMDFVILEDGERTTEE